MSLLLQNILALSVVAMAALFVIYQATSSLRGKRSKLGSCCSKGCTPPKPTDDKTERVVFFPAEMLKKHK